MFFFRKKKKEEPRSAGEKKPDEPKPTLDGEKASLLLAIEQEANGMVSVQGKRKDVLEGISKEILGQEKVMTDLANLLSERSDSFQELALINMTKLSAAIIRMKAVIEEELPKISELFKRHEQNFDIIEGVQKNLLTEMTRSDYDRFFQPIFSSYSFCKKEYWTLLEREILDYYHLRTAIAIQLDMVNEVIQERPEKTLKDPTLFLAWKAKVDEQYQKELAYFRNVAGYFKKSEELPLNAIVYTVRQKIETDAPKIILHDTIRMNKLRNIGTFRLRKDDSDPGLDADYRSILPALERNESKETIFLFHSQNHDFSRWIELADPDFANELFYYEMKKNMEGFINSLRIYLDKNTI